MPHPYAVRSLTNFQWNPPKDYSCTGHVGAVVVVVLVVAVVFCVGRPLLFAAFSPKGFA